MPIGIGLLVWAIGMGLGGPTGFAMNKLETWGRGLPLRFCLSRTRLTLIGNMADCSWNCTILWGCFGSCVREVLSGTIDHTQLEESGPQDCFACLCLITKPAKMILFLLTVNFDSQKEKCTLRFSFTLHKLLSYRKLIRQIMLYNIYTDKLR